MKIDINFLKEHPDYVYVFGETFSKKLNSYRELNNTYGFKVKKEKGKMDDCFYHPGAYLKVYKEEIDKLKKFIESNKNKKFIVDKLGFGKANRFKIYEEIIKNNLPKDLGIYPNVILL